MEAFVNLMLISSLLKFMISLLQFKGIDLPFIAWIDGFSKVNILKTTHKTAIRHGTICVRPKKRKEDSKEFGVKAK